MRVCRAKLQSLIGATVLRAQREIFPSHNHVEPQNKKGNQTEEREREKK